MLLAREGLEEDRLREGLESAAGEALQHAEDDEGRKAVGHPAEEGGQCEAGHTNQQQTLATKSAGEPSRHRKDDGVRDQVGGDDRRAFVDAGGEVAGDVQDRDVDDGGVEQLNKGGERVVPKRKAFNAERSRAEERREKLLTAKGAKKSRKERKERRVASTGYRVASPGLRGKRKALTAKSAMGRIE